MDRHTELRRTELESYGYIVPSEKEIKAMEEKLEYYGKVYKEVSEKPKKIKPVVKEEAGKPDGTETDDEFAYLDDLET